MAPLRCALVEAPLRLRAARPSDLEALLSLAQPVLCLGSEAAGREAEHLAERLELPPGEDHFLLLAEGEPEGSAAGYLSGGGCRDEDRKGSAEIYELLVAPGPLAATARRELLLAAVGILAGASYEALVIWAGAGARAQAEGLRALGFSPDGARRPGASRYLLAL